MAAPQKAHMPALQEGGQLGSLNFPETKGTNLDLFPIEFHCYLKLFDELIKSLLISPGSKCHHGIKVSLQATGSCSDMET